MKISTLQQVKNSSTVIDFHKTRLANLDTILSHKEALEAKFATWIEEEKQKLAAMKEDEFVGYKDHSLYPAEKEVMPSYPPAYIVGPCDNENGNTILVEDQELATVTLEEVNCQYMYSNPTGLFNLSVPDKKIRNSANYQ